MSQFEISAPQCPTHYSPAGNGDVLDTPFAAYPRTTFPFLADTGVNEKLIARFGTTRREISSGFPFDSDNFDPYCKEMIMLCLQDYDWQMFEMY
jgi:hypothetical protein